MTERTRDEHVKIPKELSGLSDLASYILEERPSYVFVADAHINSEPQDIAARLIEALAQNPQCEHGIVGFYVEALYDYAKPEEGDFRGAVIEWDSFHRGLQKAKGTHYRETIQSAVRAGIHVHGIDRDKHIDPESEERMRHWEAHIKAGPEPIKILLVGSGHLWNTPQISADLMHRLDKPQWVVKNEHAYSPQGYEHVLSLDISRSVSTERGYRVVTYTSK